jgi:hypothetical protein
MIHYIWYKGEIGLMFVGVFHIDILNNNCFLSINELFPRRRKAQSLPVAVIIFLAVRQVLSYPLLEPPSGMFLLPAREGSSASPMKRDESSACPREDASHRLDPGPCNHRGR